MANGSEKVSSSMFDTIKDSVRMDEIIKKVQGSKELLLWGAVYGGIGFIAGFFFKIYSRYLVALLLFIGALIGLSYLGVLSIVIHQAKLNSLFGIQSAIASDQVIVMFFEWIKMNIFISITFTIGFLLGIRVG